jgi:hypothetical protein
VHFSRAPSQSTAQSHMMRSGPSSLPRCGHCPPSRWSDKPRTLREERLLDPVLCLRVRNREPLHIPGLVQSAAFERNDVVHDVPRAGADCFAGGRARILPLKFATGGRVPLDPPVCVALAGRALRRDGPGVAAQGAGLVDRSLRSRDVARSICPVRRAGATGAPYEGFLNQTR